MVLAVGCQPAMDRAQHRIIDGVLYARSSTPYAFDLRVQQLGKYVEACALPRHAWHEVGALSPSALSDAAMAEGHIFVDGAWVPYVPSQKELLDKAAQNLERSTRRARGQVRKLVKHKALDTMLTLTYRENVTDRDRLRRDVDVMVKRLRRVMPHFEYICVFERQKRGAWHAHIACHRVQSHYLHRGVLVRSYDLLRSLWRAVVGDAGGNVDVSRQKAVKRSSGRLAGYLSKYIGKAIGDGEQGNSYSASGRALPRPLVIRYPGSSSTDAVAALWSLIRDDFPLGSDFYGAYLDGGGYYASAGPPS
jgi:hypothetical protein